MLRWKDEYYHQTHPSCSLAALQSKEKKITINNEHKKNDFVVIRVTIITNPTVKTTSPQDYLGQEKRPPKNKVNR